MSRKRLWVVVPRGGYVDAAEKRLGVWVSADEIAAIASIVGDPTVTVGAVGTVLTMEHLKRACESRGEQ